MSYTTILHQKSGHNTTHVHIFSHSKSHCRSHRSHMNLNNIPSTPHFTPLQVLKVTGDFCSIFHRWDACSFYTPYHLSTTTPIPTYYSHLTFMNTHIESLHIFITFYTISESGAKSHSTSYQSHSHNIHTPFPHPLHDISSQSTHPSRYHSHHHSTQQLRRIPSNFLCARAGHTTTEAQCKADYKSHRQLTWTSPQHFHSISTAFPQRSHNIPRNLPS